MGGEVYAVHKMGARQCSRCATFCLPYSAGQKKMYCRCRLTFCFECLHPWKSNNDSECNCGLCPQGCGVQQILKILREAPLKEKPIAYCNVSNVPAYRACPKCGSLCEHIEACKHVTCTNPKCKTCFCFICVKTQAEHQG